MKFFALLLIILMQFIYAVPKAYAVTATVDLGNVTNFAVMGAAAISDTPTSSITGDVGLWFHGGASITGLQCIEVTGTIYDSTVVLTSNMTTIINTPQ